MASILVPNHYSSTGPLTTPVAASEAWRDISFDDFIMIPVEEDSSRLQSDVSLIQSRTLPSADTYSAWPDGSPVDIAWPTPESMLLLKPSPDLRTSTDRLDAVNVAQERLNTAITMRRHDELDDDDDVLQGRHAPSRSQRGVYRCGNMSCHRVYDRACDLRKHRKQAHLPRSKWSFECKPCSTEFFSKRDWLRHIDTRKHKTSISELLVGTPPKHYAEQKYQPGGPDLYHNFPGLLTPPWQPPSPHSNLSLWQACWKPPEKARPLQDTQATEPDFSASENVPQWYSADPARFTSFDTPPNEAVLLETPFHFTPSPGNGSAPHRGARV
jgi:hypothetical protein